MGRRHRQVHLDGAEQIQLQHLGDHHEAIIDLHFEVLDYLGEAIDLIAQVVESATSIESTHSA